MGLDFGDELHEEHFVWRKSPFREAALVGGPPPTSDKLCSKFALPQNPGGQIKEGTWSSQRICTNHRWTTPKTEKVHCLPHHALIRKDTKTTMVRIAYDASLKETFGTSFNDCLHVGPPPNPLPVTCYPLPVTLWFWEGNLGHVKNCGYRLFYSMQYWGITLKRSL